MIPFESKAALLLIDIQKGLDEWVFYGDNRNNLEAEGNAAKILGHWRNLNLPVFHIQHASQNLNSPLHASKPGFEIKKEVQPIRGEPIIVKHVNSAFIGTDLKARLEEKQITHLVIVGLTTNHCVSSTVRMASNYGFKTFLVADATAAFDQTGLMGEKFDADLVHEITLANLKDEFAELVTTEGLLNS